MADKKGVMVIKKNSLISDMDGVLRKITDDGVFHSTSVYGDQLFIGRGDETRPAKFQAKIKGGLLIKREDLLIFFNEGNLVIVNEKDQVRALGLPPVLLHQDFSEIEKTLTSENL